MEESPFDSIESARQYVRLLAEEVERVRGEIANDLDDATLEGERRRADALHLVDYKLKQLAQHLGESGRILNDLQMLRRLLVQRPERVNSPTPLPPLGLEVR
jgi:hypothetical protein